MATLTDEAGPAQRLSHESVGHAVCAVRSHVYVTQMGALQARWVGWQPGQLGKTDRVLGWTTPSTVAYWTHCGRMICTPCVTSRPKFWLQVREHGPQLVSSHCVVVHGGLGGHGVVTGLKGAPPQ